MTAFPTLTAKPHIGLGIETIDNSLKSTMVNGMTISRKAYSRQLSKFSVTYPAMNVSDLNTLRTFYSTVNGGSASFTWTNPDTALSHTVRFDGNLSYKAVTYDYWEVSFSLAEV